MWVVLVLLKNDIFCCCNMLNGFCYNNKHFRQHKTVFHKGGYANLPAWDKLTEYWNSILPEPIYSEDESGVGY